MPSRLIIREDNTAIPIYLKDPLLSSDECDLIVKKMKDHDRLKSGLVGDGTDGGYVVMENYRIVRVADILESDFPWLYERMKSIVRLINVHFEFELYGIMDDIMFMRYDEPGGKFNWHTDNGSNMTGLRKISLSVGLNDPSEYEGGEFQIFHNGICDVGKIEKGIAVSFPSYRPHRVMEVRKGVRYVLVLFVLGPRFK